MDDEEDKADRNFPAETGGRTMKMMMMMMVAVVALSGCATFRGNGGSGILATVETMGPPLAAAISQTECRALACSDAGSAAALERSLNGLKPAIESCTAVVAEVRANPALCPQSPAPVQ